MSRLRSLPGRFTLALGALAVLLATAACDEEGKTAPARCADPMLPLFDPATTDAPDDDNQMYPCVTPVGHAVSFVGSAPGPTAGTGNSAGSGGSGQASAGASQGGAADGEGGAGVGGAGAGGESAGGEGGATG